MATAISIGKLRYDVSANTEGLRQELQKARADMRTFNRAMRETETPVDRYNRKLNQLRTLEGKGKITTDQYRQAVVALKREFQAATGITDRRTKAQQRLNREVTEYARREQAAANASRKRMQQMQAMQRGGGFFTPGRLAGMAAAAISVQRIAQFTADAVREFANFERMQADFQALTGSISVGNELMENFTDLANRAGMSVTQIAKAGQTMLAFGVAPERVTDSLEQLMEVSGGSSERLQSLALAFSQVQAAGRLMGQDLLQLINAGWNPLVQISEETGETMQELRDRMADTGISVEEVQRALDRATGSGGIFEGRLDAMANTTQGSINRMNAAWTEFKRNVGEFVSPGMEKGFEFLTRELKTISEVMEGYNDWLGQASGEDVDVPFRLVTDPEEERAREEAQAAREQANREAAEFRQREQEANLGIQEQIEALKLRNMELEFGAEWVEKHKISQSDASQAVKLEWQALRDRNEQLKKAADLEKQRNEEIKRRNIERQQDRIAAQRDVIRDLEKQKREVERVRQVSFADTSAGQRGSRQEYQLIRQAQQANNQRREQARLQREANRRAQAIQNAIDQQTRILEMMEKKLPALRAA